MSNNLENPADLLEVCKAILAEEETTQDVIDQSAYSTDELIHELALFYVIQHSKDKRRPETLEEIADKLLALRSALNPTKHQFVWDELSKLAEDIRRIAHAPQKREDAR